MTNGIGTKKLWHLTLFFALILFLFLGCNILAEDWKIYKSDHFSVYYEEDLSFTQRVGYKAEEYYKQLDRSVGFTRFGKFWTFDKRCKIYVYANKKNYLENNDIPSWSAGFANYDKREIVSYKESENFLISLLPHEMTHLILADFIEKNIPLWFNEGLAVSMELTSKSGYISAIKEELKKDACLSIYEVLDKTGYPEDEEKVLLFYSISYSLVDFLRSKGQYRFTNLCRALRDGKSFEDALRSSYQFDFENLERLDEKWQEHIKK
ncbi:MAG: peptidase MA family metallohydrolase [bacterium]|nr:peptidase MA family metallohydrolase [bacterium]